MKAVAIVGRRQMTPYGLETARKLAYQLAYVGVTVVSGGARGIDTAAHQGTLSAKGRTLAVLGTGINLVFQPSNQPAAPSETGVLPALELNDSEQKVFALLTLEAETTRDEVIRGSGLPPSAVAVALLSLEMKRLIKQKEVY